MRISKMRWAIVCLAMLGLTGCKSGSLWPAKFSKKSTPSSSSALAQTPPQVSSPTSLPSAGATPQMASNAGNPFAGAAPAYGQASPYGGGNPYASTGANTASPYGTTSPYGGGTASPYGGAAPAYGTTAAVPAYGATGAAPNAYADPNSHYATGGAGGGYGSTPASGYASAPTSGYPTAQPASYPTAQPVSYPTTPAGAAGYDQNAAAMSTASQQNAYNYPTPAAAGSTAAPYGSYNPGASTASPYASPAGSAAPAAAPATNGRFGSNNPYVTPSDAGAVRTADRYDQPSTDRYSQVQPAAATAAWGSSAPASQNYDASSANPAWKPGQTDYQPGQTGYGGNSYANTTQTANPYTASPNNPSAPAAQSQPYRPGGTGDYVPDSGATGAAPSNYAPPATSNVRPANYETPDRYAPTGATTPPSITTPAGY